MVDQHGRGGRVDGAGFYDYPEKGKKHLWPGLGEIFPTKADAPPFEDMMDRMLFIQVLETVRCHEEDVVTSVADANIGSIFGWGFAPFKGGTLQFINDYGIPEFVERSRELALLYGERFNPPDLLIEMAESGKRFE